MFTEKAMYSGSHVQTRESFLYGRFETMVNPAFGSGIISSFFLFSDTTDYKVNWAEIDFEFLGRNTNQADTNVIQTIGGVTDKNVGVKKHVLNKRSEDTFWKLSIMWEPKRIVWSINDITVRELKVSINKPMKLMMNLWASDNANWAGEVSPGLLPQSCEFLYVRYSSYVANMFLYEWQDEFFDLDKSRWYLGDWKIGQTILSPMNILYRESKLILSLH